MDRSVVNAYRCPVDHSPLRIADGAPHDGAVETGELISAAGRRYRIESGVPHFADPDELSPAAAQVRSFYDSAANGVAPL